MRFNRFGVVEFKDKGNAAYVYPIQIMKEYLNLRKKNRYPISYYKNKSKTIRLSVDPSWDGRIIHREGWQETVTDKIKYILK